MASIRNTLVKTLALYLALLPCLGLRAEAQVTEPVETPRPFDPPRPVDPPRPEPRDETVFTAGSKPITIRAFNGFSSDTTPGLFHHQGHGHRGGVATVDSPWGEQMQIRYWVTPHGLTFEYDGELKVRYRFAELGTLEEIVAETPERTARMTVGNRAELAYLGQRDFASFDLSAYQVIEEALRARHSEAFLAGLGQFDGAAEVSCTTQAIQCAACIITWAVSVGAIATACIVGGVPTFGFACFLAILAHEATNFACAATCIEWAEDCLGGRADDGKPIPDGCEP